MKFWRVWRATKDLVKQTLRERKPAAVIGMGGYAAGVAVKVAAMKNIPTAIINPDVIPGKANQYLMPYTRRVCCQFPSRPPITSPQSSRQARKSPAARSAPTSATSPRAPKLRNDSASIRAS